MFEMFSNLTRHTRQTHFLPTTMKPMSAVFNVNHNAPKSTECLFLSQDRIEPGPSVSFLQSAPAVDETVVFPFLYWSPGAELLEKILLFL